MARFNWLQLDTGFRRFGAWALVMLGITCALPAQVCRYSQDIRTGCLACHTVYPELTHFGRMFKLNGYQLDNGKDITMITDEGKQQLALPAVPNLGLFVISRCAIGGIASGQQYRRTKIVFEWEA